MEFSENSTKKRIKKESFVDKTKEPHLLFYRIPPIENISLSEFEELAKRRLAGKSKTVHHVHRPRPTTSRPSK